MTGMILMVSSGLLIFIGGAVGYFMGEWFRLNMILLITALVFHFSVFRTVVRANADRYSLLAQRGTAAFELLIWLGVGAAGRTIAFF